MSVSKEKENHYTRPHECSTKYLEKIEKMDEFPDKDLFMKELSKRRSRPKARDIRLSRNRRSQEIDDDRRAEHNKDSGDTRKMK